MGTVANRLSKGNIQILPFTANLENGRKDAYELQSHKEGFFNESSFKSKEVLRDKNGARTARNPKPT